MVDHRYVLTPSERGRAREAIIHNLVPKERRRIITISLSRAGDWQALCVIQLEKPALECRIPDFRDIRARWFEELEPMNLPLPPIIRIPLVEYSWVDGIYRYFARAGYNEDINVLVYYLHHSCQLEPDTPQ